MRLRTSALGEDFPPERFLRTPVDKLVEIAEMLDNEEQRQANILGSPVGKLAITVMSIAHGMSGSKGPKPKTDITSYLPFPDWAPLTAKSRFGPSLTTKAALTEALRRRLIPPHVYTALSNPPEDG